MLNQSSAKQALRTPGKARRAQQRLFAEASRSMISAPGALVTLGGCSDHFELGPTMSPFSPRLCFLPDPPRKRLVGASCDTSWQFGGWSRNMIEVPASGFTSHWAYL